ncbi:MAG: lysostaphin resistance A-like protein [Promethearchaeota archaeon]
MNEVKKFETRNILLFLLVTFTWTLLFWLPSVLSPTGNSNQMIFALFIIGGYGPFVGAFLITFINERKSGVKVLWKRFWNPKIKIKWLLITFLLIPSLYILSSVIAILFQGDPPILEWISQPWVIISYIITAFFAGGFPEEFGWRGYLLDRFQVRGNMIISSLIIGIIWGFWHLPVWLMPDDSHSLGILNFFLFLIDVIFASILFTWLYNNTNKSILIAVILHTMLNFTSFLIFLSSLGEEIYRILLYITGILVIVFSREKEKSHLK